MKFGEFSRSLPWQVRWLATLGALCITLFAVAVFANSNTYKAYQIDLEYNRKECDAEAKAEHGKHTKDCQTILYRTFDDPVALLTGALTLATVFLFIVTFGLYVTAARQGADAKDALRAARDSADAAKRSADAAILAIEKGETPYLHPTFRLVDPEVAAPNIAPGTWAKFIVCEFTNYGKSPAVIKSISLQLVEADYIRQIEVNLGVQALGEHAAVIPAGATEKLQDIPVSREQYGPVDPGVGFLLNKGATIEGHVRYADILGTEYITGISYKTAVFGAPFYPYDKYGSNKRRKLTEEEIRTPSVILI